LIFVAEVGWWFEEMTEVVWDLRRQFKLERAGEIEEGEIMSEEQLGLRRRGG
jgi:hypothetical protein